MGILLVWPDPSLQILEMDQTNRRLDMSEALLEFSTNSECGALEGTLMLYSQNLMVGSSCNNEFEGTGYYCVSCDGGGRYGTIMWELMLKTPE
jgi:hypothetical protein